MLGFRSALIAVFAVVPGALQGAEWEKIDCGVSPVQIARSGFPADGFVCHSAEGAERRFADIQQRAGSLFIEANQIEATGTHHEASLGERETLALAQGVDAWARDHGRNWTPFKPLAGGGYSLFFGREPGDTLPPMWSCFAHHALAVPKDGGFRYRRFVLYCEENVRARLSEQTVLSTLAAVSWPDP